MNRFFVPPDWINGNTVCLHDGYAHQICHVLRLKAGDAIVVLDNSGVEYEVNLIDVSKHQVVGEIQSQQQCHAEPQTRIVLYQSMLKRDKFEWVLQKCTEIGVSCIVPVITTRSIVQKKEIKVEKLQRWRQIMREAAEQCGRGRVPELVEPMGLEPSFKHAESLSGRVMASLDGRQQSLPDAIQTVATESNPSVGVWIGPEGGFAPEEVAMACESGLTCVRFGKRVLRTETAAVVACSLILHELEDL